MQIYIKERPNKPSRFIWHMSLNKLKRLTGVTPYRLLSPYVNMYLTERFGWHNKDGLVYKAHINTAPFEGAELELFRDGPANGLSRYYRSGDVCLEFCHRINPLLETEGFPPMLYTSVHLHLT